MWVMPLPSAFVCSWWSVIKIRCTHTLPRPFIGSDYYLGGNFDTHLDDVEHAFSFPLSLNTYGSRTYNVLLDSRTRAEAAVVVVVVVVVAASSANVTLSETMCASSGHLAFEQRTSRLNRVRSCRKGGRRTRMAVKSKYNLPHFLARGFFMASYHWRHTAYVANNCQTSFPHTIQIVFNLLSLWIKKHRVKPNVIGFLCTESQKCIRRQIQADVLDVLILTCAVWFSCCNDERAQEDLTEHQPIESKMRVVRRILAAFKNS